MATASTVVGAGGRVPRTSALKVHLPATRWRVAGGMRNDRPGRLAGAGACAGPQYARE